MPAAKPRPKIKAGKSVSSETAVYIVDDVLGSGGFGDVYLVEKKDDDSGVRYAMKTEFNDAKRRKMLDRLKVEMSVFSDANQIDDETKKAHFVRMFDRGRTADFKFIVMGLVSYSIESIPKDVLKAQLKMSSVIKVGLQTLESIRDIHAMGYIHRDVKPHNFAIGRPPDESIIFMLDFGIARRYLEKDRKMMRIPRYPVKFLGTVKFASRNCHNRKEQSRPDDLEMWIYMLLDLIKPANLIWRKEIDRSEVLNMKMKVFKDPACMTKVPKGFEKIMTNVNKLEYGDTPDYAELERLLRDCAKNENIDLNMPFEWIGKTCEKAKKKKRVENQLQDDENDNTEDRKRLRKEQKPEEKKSKGKEKEKKSSGEESKEDEEGTEDLISQNSKENKSAMKDVSTMPVLLTKKSSNKGPGRKLSSKRKKKKGASEEEKKDNKDKKTSTPSDNPPSIETRAYTNNSNPFVTVEPEEIRWTKTAIAAKLKVENISGERLVVKAKCSDIISYRINPVFSFLEISETIEWSVERVAMPTKPGRMVLMVAKCKTEDIDCVETMKETPVTKQVKVNLPMSHCD